jgi:hypothetical protein
MLIADTSPLVAILNAKDKHHQARRAVPAVPQSGHRPDLHHH